MKKNKMIILMFVLMMFVPFVSISAASKVSCGSITNIPAKIPELTRDIMVIVQVAVPIVLVITGMLDLFKGVTAQKEDEIKKGQQTLIKRLIVAALIFFIVVIVKFVVSIVADTSSSTIIDCIDCFVGDGSTCPTQ